jgi:hypothetical protein
MANSQSRLDISSVQVQPQNTPPGENCRGVPVGEHGGGRRPRVHIRAIPSWHDQNSAGTHTVEAKSKQAMPNLRLLVRPLSRLSDHREP